MRAIGVQKTSFLRDASSRGGRRRTNLCIERRRNQIGFAVTTTEFFLRQHRLHQNRRGLTSTLAMAASSSSPKTTPESLKRLQNGSDVRGVALDGVENEPITITSGDRTLFTGIVRRTIATLAKTLAERGDPQMMCPGEVGVAMRKSN